MPQVSKPAKSQLRFKSVAVRWDPKVARNGFLTHWIVWASMTWPMMQNIFSLKVKYMRCLGTPPPIFHGPIFCMQVVWFLKVRSGEKWVSACTVGDLTLQCGMY